MTATIAPIRPALRHDPDTDAEGACIPRVLLTCASCRAEVVFCHVSTWVLRDYLDGQWHCSAWCAVVPLARDFVILLAVVTLLALVLVVWGGEVGLP